MRWRGFSYILTALTRIAGDPSGRLRRNDMPEKNNAMTDFCLNHAMKCKKWQ